MKRFIEGEDRGQSTLFPERLDEYIGEDNPVRVIDVFVDELDLGDLGFERAARPARGWALTLFRGEFNGRRGGRLFATLLFPKKRAEVTET